MQMTESYRVMKFGGSSVGAPERIQRVVTLICRERAIGPVAVVISAMGDTTDWLIEATETAKSGDYPAARRVADRIRDLAVTNGLGAFELLKAQNNLEADAPDIAAIVDPLHEELCQLLRGISLLREASTQTLDLILSFGERISNSVIAPVVTANGVPAVYQDAREWTITTDAFGYARVRWNSTQRALDEVRTSWDGRVPINTGFLGRTADGRTTTLGRNGSDYTATLLARGLGAAEVMIWTDVSGVFTADPRIVSDAYPIERLSYMEALELAYFGTRMFHSRTMVPLIESGIPMRIRNTMRPDDAGTVVGGTIDSGQNRPTSVTSLEDLALLDVEVRSLDRQVQIGERVLRALRKAGVPAWMATQAGHGQAIAVAIPRADVERASEQIRDELVTELEQNVVDPIRVIEPVTLLSLVAETMGSTPNVSGSFFSTLGGVGINIRAIAQGATGRSISCVIDAEDTVTAVRTVHSAFNFAHQKVSLLVLGRGTVGAQLLSQIRAQHATLINDHRIHLDVVAIADSNALLFEPEGIDLTKWKSATAKITGDERPIREVTLEALDKLSRMPVPILVDCTAAGGMQDLYKEAFKRRIHVVAANKKPLTIAWPEREELMQCAADNHRRYHYETTVGASLPVIETLKNLVRTGDTVRLIEGSFSGTLGYLTNEAMAGVHFSEAVREARDLGYTEPMPQDDLSGLDVARKALILARELGVAADISEVRVEPLVPHDIINIGDLEEFFAALKRYNATMAEQVRGLKQEKKSLRYLARIEPLPDNKAKLSVGPVAVSANHPASRLRGSETFVAFTTARYREYPLIVQGAGAGGAVTAAGVLADILHISQGLRLM